MIEAPVPIRRYSFGPRTQSGLTFGVSWSEASLVATSLFASVLLLRLGHGRDRALIAVLVFGAGLVTATLPIAGRTTQQWLPVLVRYVLASLQHDRRSVPVRRDGPVSPRSVPPFSDVSVVAFEGPGGEIGVLLDRQNATASAVLDVTGTPFALADSTARQQLVDAWAGLLEAVAQQPGSLFRLAWIERVVPDQAVTLHADAASAFAIGGTEAIEVAPASYIALLASESRRAVRHDSHVVVTAHAPRSHDWAPTFTEAVMSFSSRCREIGLGTGGFLSSGGVRSYLRRQFADGVLAEGGGAVFPLGVEESWAEIRTDASWHATYWVAEWPRTEVGCDFLLPLLMQPRLRRTVTVVMEPLPPARAVRAAERTRTSNTADASLRHRHGFAITARNAREHEAAARREVELAAGHRAFRFSGFLTVTASTRDQLQRDCERLEQAAASAHLDLRRLFGSQRLALANVLPIGRGL